ncbi:MAG TPA: NAD(P)/FAD-dependent oxidoreductase [Acidimicrobiales bacterium]|nr:NAD(P)/FAD-dependent oxidoreductase [Acidimicrobiales bacterium]
MSTEADVVVVGMGVGGEEVAGSLAEAGLDVVGIEERLVGGECPYWACVPTKMMTRAAGLIAEARRIPGMAGTVSVAADWSPVAARIRDEATDDWDDRAAVERFESKGGRFVRGRARVVAPGTVEVDGQQITARRGLVIATGTAPAVPPIPGLEDVEYWTNRQAVEATEAPTSLIVLGAGAVGAEMSQVFARFGTEVTLVEGAERVLPLEEPESSQLVAEVFGREGIKLHTGVRAEAVSSDQRRISVRLSDGATVSAERLLVATGRRTNLAGLGLSTLGLDDEARSIPTDEHMRAARGLWAVGDVTGVAAFTHVAMYQARIAISDILGRDHAPADYRALPRVTFTDPEVGSVGLTERAARDAGIDVRTSGSPIPSSSRGWIHKAGNDGLIKLVADQAEGVLVGATSVGPVGGEVLSMLVLAIKARVPMSELREMIYAYPTFHRAVEAAVAGLTA